MTDQHAAIHMTQIKEGLGGRKKQRKEALSHDDCVTYRLHASDGEDAFRRRALAATDRGRFCVTTRYRGYNYLRGSVVVHALCQWRALYK
jgi:hypothetical protein